ncbi:MAG: type II toxin-antitoxin system HicA family toxin [Polyangiaceae bacterium]|nr:type II toxin-antitoxin system HicA family toxin [Polyangiaceae bacterium]
MKSSRDVIRQLQAAGWALVRVKGDHHHFKHDLNPAIVTVPHPKRDLSFGVLKTIERITGLKLS